MSKYDPPLPIGLAITLLVVALLVMCGCYACTNSNCEARGGHTEIVYGGRGGWVCDGADR